MLIGLAVAGHDLHSHVTVPVDGATEVCCLLSAYQLASARFEAACLLLLADLLSLDSFSDWILLSRGLLSHRLAAPLAVIGLGADPLLNITPTSTSRYSRDRFLVNASIVVWRAKVEATATNPCLEHSLRVPGRTTIIAKNGAHERSLELLHLCVMAVDLVADGSVVLDLFHLGVAVSLFLLWEHLWLAAGFSLIGDTESGQ